MSKAKQVNAIVPTIGRQVWFWSSAEKRIAAGADKSVQPEAATVVHVLDERCVNLLVLDHKGRSRAVQHALLVQPDDDWDESTGPHCQWMPFQVGQARAT